MILDLIIPQYKEKEDEVKVLLDSINNQIDVDFNNIFITIVNDKSDTLLSDSFLKSYNKLNIKYLINDKNTGPGLARQKGIDNTLGDYIMFFDSDDKLFCNDALKTIIEYLNKYNPKYVVTNIVVEVYLNGKNALEIRKGRDTFPWMHGKVYQREFLEKNNIRFHETVRQLEDSYFTTCILGVLKPSEISFLDFNSYLWRKNDKSITRKKSKYSYAVETFDEYFNTAEYIYELLFKKKSYLRFSFLVDSYFGIYIFLNCDLFDFDELKSKRDYYSNELDKLIIKRKNIFKLFEKEELEKLFIDEAKNLKRRNGINEIYVSFNDFYNKYLNMI